ncbi:MAG: SGNH/GDSL hydrolase family protein [Anaerolineae bacterium]|nr:SGNH/GDSL hydrolase family protein [Anaerolineae bacterium]
MVEREDKPERTHWDQVLDRLRAGQRTRLVAFGSSNTERRIQGLHWFDWLDLALKHTHGRVHHMINAGLGGDTTRGLIRRFDEDVALYQPHGVLVTIGGNDANPESGIDDREYARNLGEIVARLQDLGASVFLQTYYSADIARMAPGHGAAFLRYMEIVRRTAAETGVALIDHHRRWEPLRLTHPDRYRRLMIDPLHVNALGNTVIGLDLVRAFGAQLPEDQLAHCAAGRGYQQVLDHLARPSAAAPRTASVQDSAG